MAHTWSVRSFLVLALVAGLLPGAAWAQSGGTISGTVRVSRTNQPLSGAQITVDGTTRGAVTAPDGSYTVTGVPAGTHAVTARSVGYQASTQQVTVAAGQVARADFGMTESAIELEGLVVTGQGTAVEQRKLSTSVATINAQEIEEAPVTDVTQLLQGRVPGATVNAVSGQPGGAGLVRFRGVTSIVGSQTPVIYIDGVRVDNSSGNGFDTGGELTSALADLLVSDIERVEVIKGGAASTLYGSDAAAGVIQIFTKKGSAGEPRITARIEQGFDQPETKFIKDVGFSFPDLVEEEGVNPDLVKDDFLQDGRFQNYYLAATGGTEDVTYNISGRVQNSTGVQVKNDETIYALRGGVQAFVSDELTVDFNGSYTRDNFNRVYNGDAIANPLTSFEVGDALFFTGAETLDEALRIFLLPDINEKVNRFIFGTTATYRPNDLFTSRFTTGVDYRSSEQRLSSPIEYEPLSGVLGEIDRYNRNFSAVTVDWANTLSYPRDGAFTSDFTFGVQGYRNDESWVTAGGSNFALPGTEDLDAGALIEAAEFNEELFSGGLYVQERVGLWDRLFVEGGFRVDNNSAFGEDVGYTLYPKVGASYNISDEPWFLEGLGDYANAVKLRVAYGEAGKPPTAFARDRTFTASSFRGESAPSFDNPGNPDLSPEITSTLEAGVDAGLFDNRLGINFTWYNARTRDALIYVAEQPSTGGFSQLRNIGEIRNTGIELAANLDVLRLRNVDWRIGATYNQVENEVTDLGDVQPFSLSHNRRVEEGKPIGAYFVNTPIDTNGDGKNDNFERQFLGTQPFPTKTGSFNTDLTLFQDLTISALVDWARGATVVDYGSAWASFNGLERVTFPTRYSLAGEEIGTYGYTQAFSALLMNGDYTKLREVTVRYALPFELAERLGTQRTSVFLSGRNLVTWVPEKQCLYAIDCLSNLVDPELAGEGAGSGQVELGGATSTALPAPRQFRLGIEVSF